MKVEEYQREDDLLREEIIRARQDLQKKMQRERRARRRRLIEKMACVAALGMIGIAIVKTAALAFSGDNEIRETDIVNREPVDMDISSENADAPVDVAWEEAEMIPDELILVNKDHALPEDYEIELHWLENGKTAVSAQMYDALREMLTAGTENGLSFIVASGYRDSSYQQRLLEEDIDAAMRRGMSYEEAYREETRETMPPGHSEHETGLAVDIVSSDYQTLDEGQENTAEYQWLRDHCSQYGFILRYPPGSEEITGISYEPWHFRYVGKEAAAEITEWGITLEEYLDILNKKTTSKEEPEINEEINLKTNETGGETE